MRQKETQTKRFRAILNVNGKNKAFTNNYSTPARLIKALKENGISLKQVVKIEEYTALG